MTCAKPHAIRTPDGSFVPALEMLGSHATDAWARCRNCGAMFWAVDDDGKYGYSNQWELDPWLAQAALVLHDARALARLFVSMDLPKGPLWDFTGALVEIFRALTPTATDAERRDALQEAGSHPRWSKAARTFADNARRAAPPGEEPLPIDLSLPATTFREWYELSDSVVLLTDKAELLRLEPRGLTRLELAFPPRRLAYGHDRLMVSIGDSSLAVIDAGGWLSTWPRSHAFSVTSLDDGWWLTVPDDGAIERAIELRLPDGRPRVKWMRRFAGAERWIYPPRRVGTGWVVTNLVDVNGATQALTLFDEAFHVVAASSASPGSPGGGAPGADREVTPIDRNSFWAYRDGTMERWVRSGDALECRDTFEARSSWWTKGLLISDTRGGVVTARQGDGTVRWTYRRETSGATYGVVAPCGVLLYDDAHGVLLDLEGNVRRMTDVESARVQVAVDGTVFLKTLAHLWIFADDACECIVGTGLELETTCGDAALLRRADGMCLLVGKRGGSATFHAKDAWFPVWGTRGGPWIIEGGRIRGVFALNAHTMAESVAVRLGGVARELPSRDASEAFTVVLPDGRAPVLVRRSSLGAMVVTVAGGRSWSVGIPAGPAEISSMASEVAVAALGYPSFGAPTLAEMALAAIDLLSAAFEEPWTVSIPGVSDPREMWLQGGDQAAARVGVFPGLFTGALDQPIPVADRSMLASTREPLVAAVREQHRRYRLHTALSASVHTLADGLASRLSARLGVPHVASSRGVPSYETTAEDHIALASNRLRTVVWVAAVKEELAEHATSVHAPSVHAGAPGAAGWDGRGADPDAMLEDIVAAIDRMSRTLTIERLVPGRRYRVIGEMHGATKGEILAFEGFDDIDNHYGEYIFLGEDGRTVKVVGDYGARETSPLAEVYRMLEEA